MRKLVASALALASLLVGYAALTAEGADRPSNVDAANWIQVSDTVGFVVIPEKKSETRIASSSAGACGTGLLHGQDSKRLAASRCRRTDQGPWNSRVNNCHVR
jgi:hypothetical protein